MLLMRNPPQEDPEKQTVDHKIKPKPKNREVFRGPVFNFVDPTGDDESEDESDSESSDDDCRPRTQVFGPVTHYCMVPLGCRKATQRNSLDISDGEHPGLQRPLHTTERRKSSGNVFFGPVHGLTDARKDRRNFLDGSECKTSGLRQPSNATERRTPQNLEEQDFDMEALIKEFNALTPQMQTFIFSLLQESPSRGSRFLSFRLIGKVIGEFDMEALMPEFRVLTPQMQRVIAPLVQKDARFGRLPVNESLKDTAAV